MIQRLSTATTTVGIGADEKGMLLLIPSQQGWEGSDGHAPSPAAAVAVWEDATAVQSMVCS